MDQGLNEGAPIRVAIVGGGCAAMAAAFELTRPEHGGRYAVTVYQMGWRLGGKGASGRGVNGRIEEHGLHLWLGYYENAFRLMRECYSELQRLDASAASFEDSFSPAAHTGAMDYSPSGEWLAWKVDFPTSPGLPGDPNPPRFSIADYLVHAARLLRALLSTLSAGTVGSPGPMKELGALLGSSPTSEELSEALGRLGKLAALAGLGAAVEAVRWLELVLGTLPTYPQSLVARLLDLIGDAARAQAEKLAVANDSARRVWEVAELVLATIRGAIRFRLVMDPRGFDAIDNYDCREWLRMNGASQGAIDSAFIRALYDLAFAYEKGDPQRPAIAAGSAVRGAFRAFLSYRGAFFWKMNAGMGDVVFAPFYRVLKARGARFEFFHRLLAVELSPAGDVSPHVSSLDFEVQARTVDGEEYQPLISVKGLPCWPSRPRFEQLTNGTALEASGVDFEDHGPAPGSHAKQLRVGEDFDFVVLAVGLGVVPLVCGSILARDERWQAMVSHVKSVPTQAFQLWLGHDLAGLGWRDRSINLSGFVEPFDTWADMTHLIPKEDWPTAPSTIAYFCNALEDRGEESMSAARDRVRASCIRFLDGDLRHLWPSARAQGGGFDWSSLVDPGGSRGQSGATAQRFDSQYWTANVRPSDRYSQSLPGSTQYRISPLDRTYDNLTVAGDWTSCSLNMGCVEAAVMSGMLAAHALSGLPALRAITGYDHP